MKCTVKFSPYPSHNTTFYIVKEDALQTEILIGQMTGRQLGGTGRHSFKRVVPESPTVGAGGHDALFGARHLILVQRPSTGTVGAAGFNGCLKQLDDESLPCFDLDKMIILHSNGLFHYFFVLHIRSVPKMPAIRPRRLQRRG